MGRGISHVEESPQVAGVSTPQWVTKECFAPNLQSNEEALQVIMQAIEGAGYKAGEDVSHRSGRCGPALFNSEGLLCPGSGRGQEDRTGNGGFLRGSRRLAIPLSRLSDGLDENDWGTAGSCSRKSWPSRFRLWSDDSL